MGLRIFVSHSLAKDDAPLLRDLDDMTRTVGIDLYLAERDVQPGVRLSAKVRDEIAKADIVLAVLTERGASSAWVNQEIAFAMERRKRIVPMLEEGVKPPGVIAEVEQLRFDRERPSEAFNRLARFLDHTQAKKRADHDFWVNVTIVAGFAVLIGLLIYALSKSGGGKS